MGAEDGATNRDAIREKLRENFQGKIVRKDLTKKIKEGANVPVYVLEFLLGQYCSSDDEEVIQQGVENVKQILANNYVRPDEAQKILSLLRQHGSHTIIDMVSVELNIKKDRYEASNGVNPIQGSRLIFLLVAREEAAAFASAKKPLSGKES